MPGEEATVEGDNHWQGDAKPKAKRTSNPTSLTPETCQEAKPHVGSKETTFTTGRSRAGRRQDMTQGTGYLRSVTAPPLHPKTRCQEVIPVPRASRNRGVVKLGCVGNQVQANKSSQDSQIWTISGGGGGTQVVFQVWPQAGAGTGHQCPGLAGKWV